LLRALSSPFALAVIPSLWGFGRPFAGGEANSRRRALISAAVSGETLQTTAMGRLRRNTRRTGGRDGWALISTQADFAVG
jgi:hypothetical protein